MVCYTLKTSAILQNMATFRFPALAQWMVILLMINTTGLPLHQVYCHCTQKTSIHFLEKDECCQDATATHSCCPSDFQCSGDQWILIKQSLNLYQKESQDQQQNLDVEFVAPQYWQFVYLHLAEALSVFTVKYHTRITTGRSLRIAYQSWIC